MIGNSIFHNWPITIHTKGILLKVRVLDLLLKKLKNSFQILFGLINMDIKIYNMNYLFLLLQQLYKKIIKEFLTYRKK